VDSAGLVIFDFDDTLVETSFLYTEATDEYVDLVSFWGFDRQLVRTTFLEHDRLAMETHGFGKRCRFPDSMEATLRAIWVPGGAVGVEPFAWMVKAVRSIGFSVFRRHSVSKPDLHEALGTLHGFGYELRLHTMGDPAVQQKRIDHAGIREYFWHINIPSAKDSDELEAMCYGYPKGSIWSVGDSVRSDIMPSLMLGLKTIRVYADACRPGYDTTQDVAHGNYWHAPSLKTAVDIILAEDGLQ